MSLIEALFGSVSKRELKRITPIQQKILSLEEKYAAYTDVELKAMTDHFKAELADGKTVDDILPDAFAVCREAGVRVLGQKAYPVQLIGGIVLHEGKIAEMKTGEGKTLAETFPAYLNALTGCGVHIVTVNDYLARRDSEWMGKVFQFLGLTVGLVIAGMKSADKKIAYAADITYGTNNEFGFDYLRDNMVVSLESKVQRGHAYAIIDEVDSILIDEARTPLIISGQGDKSTDLYKRANDFAKTLTIRKITETDDKVELETMEGDCIIDEKAKSVSLTQSGIEKAQRYFNVENLSDPENMTLSHHINQAMRARGLMTRDVDYVVKDGEVIIVDEFTGRLMIGRRFNEGLHQAIEAKEGVTVAHESKTLATVTFQNYFRMYKKLAGMTGTALTEQDEFSQIYGLDVIEIPTNRPVIRVDMDDVIYKTERAKFEAVIEQIIKCREKGQPVLVGTVTIEKSELLSRMLSRRGIKHEVLNAKQHEREAMIVAQAGKLNAVTIATNMAGRGTDILLGGNAEYMARSELQKRGFDDEMILNATGYFDTEDEEILAHRELYKQLLAEYSEQIKPDYEKVKEAGGLFIIGTERHESRRIDNQLRGRSGRQGDPGCSRFFLSLEDDLMRLFGGERLTAMMNTLRVEENMPIENRMLTGVIESAQKKVEGRNFSIRKNVLDYDDVMNHQRETIYEQRDMVLNGEDIKEKILGMVDESIAGNTSLYLADTDDHADWNIAGLKGHYLGWLISSDELNYTKEQLRELERNDITAMLAEKAHKIYEDKEKRIGSENMRRLERLVLLRCVDDKWMDHIDDMDQLRKGMYLQSYGQHNPVVEYRMVGYEMFDAMVDSIREDTAKLMMTAELVQQQNAQQRSAPVMNARKSEDALPQSNRSERREPVKVEKKPGRNDPCPCGSGKKYKNCHGRTPEVTSE